MADIFSALSPKVLAILQSPQYRTITKMEAIATELHSKNLYDAPKTVKEMLGKVLAVLDKPNIPKWSHGVQQSLRILPEAFLRAAINRDEGAPPWFTFRLMLGQLYLLLDREYRLSLNPKSEIVRHAPTPQPNAATAPFFRMKTE